MKMRKGAEGRVDESDEDEGEREDHGEEEPLFAAAGVREHGAGDQGDEGEGEVGDDEEDDADFGGCSHFEGAV